MIKLINNDAFKVLDKMIENNEKVDMVLIDPPYGTLKGLDYTKFSNHGKVNHTTLWDKEIDFNLLLNKFKKISMLDTNVVIFFDMKMLNFINEFIPYLSHYLVWEKDSGSNPLIFKTQPLKRTEFIGVFKWKYLNDEHKNLKEYFKKIKRDIGVSTSHLSKNIGRSIERTFSFESKYWMLPSKKHYDKLSELFNLYEREDYISYDILKKEYERRNTYNNIQESSNNVLHFSKDKTGLHPTQKPIKLMEYLVKTYSNENDTILDCFMGSGTTGVACKNLKRNFIGVELDKEYFEIAKERIECNNNNNNN